jgi:hypothetical protein
MRHFFDSVVPFLIVAVVVGFRMISMLRRRKRDGPEQGSPSDRAAPPKARGFIPWEDEFREAAPVASVAESGPAQAAAADEDEAFSAWNLSVDDEPPARTDPPRLPKAPGSDPLTAARTDSSRLPKAPGSDPLTATLAGPSRFPEAPGSELLATAPAWSIPERPKQRFRGLPPLQQGVIWAEILGAPRGL